MKGDFSRLPAAPPGASGVYLQQGRVLLDSDWNAQLEIQRRRDATLIKGLLGGDGAPVTDAGFKIQPRYAIALGGAAAQAVTVPASPGSQITLELNLTPGAAPVQLLDWPNVLSLSLVEAEGGVAVQLQPTAGGPPIGGTQSLDPARFTTLSVVIDGARQTLLVDGVVVGSSQVSGPLAGEAADGVLTIAGPEADGQGAAACRLAEVRVWATARRPDAIAADTGRLLEPNEDGLAQYYLFQPEDKNGRAFRNRAGKDGVAQAKIDPAFVVCDAWIGAGRYYVNGIACANATTFAYSSQSGVSSLPIAGESRLFYLDVWDRFETALQMPILRDTALGGGDTSGWTFTTFRVRLLSSASPKPDEAWKAFTAARSDPGAASVRRLDPTASVLTNSLYRLEVHDSGTVLGAAVGDGAAEVVIGENGHVDVQALDSTQVGRWFSLQTVGADQVQQAVLTRQGDGRLVLLGADKTPVAAGTARLSAAATYKWSNVNGCVAFPVANCAPDPSQGDKLRVTLASAGDNGFDLALGDWIEFSLDDDEIYGQPGPVYQVAGIDQAGLVVRLDNPSNSVAPVLPPDQHPVMRRWDTPLNAAGTAKGPPVRPIRLHAWDDLEAGIEVEFAAGQYRMGDYWTFTARDVAGGVVAWPLDAPSPQPPQGVAHHYAQLAMLSFGAAEEPKCDDLRTLFQPIIVPPAAPVATWTKLAAPAPAEGLTGTVLFDAPMLTVIDGDSAVIQRLNLAGGDWTASAVQQPVLKDSVMARLGFDIYAIGGRGENARRLQVLSPNGAWRQRELPAPVTRPGAGAAGGALFLLGGEEKVGRASDVIHRLDFADGVRLDAKLPTARAAPLVAEAGGRLFVIGGTADGKPSSAVDGFDPSSASCRACAPLPDGLLAVSVAGWAGKVAVLALAGADKVLQAYDPSQDRWSPMAAPPPAAVALFSDGETLYVLTATTSQSAGGIFRFD